MKKKIFGTFVILFLIFTIIPTVTSINNIDSIIKNSNIFQDDLNDISNDIIQKLEIIQLINNINILKNKTIYVDDDKPQGWYDATTHFKTIYDANRFASTGDTIYVYKGVYDVSEGINILTSLNIVGEDKNTTIITGNSRADVIRVKTSNVKINNFTLKYSKRKDASKTYAGIRIDGEYQNIYISNNILTQNSQGIALCSTSYVNIYNNEIYNNDYDGIVLQGCHECFIENNTIYNNGYNFTNKEPNGDGIDIRSSNNNIIKNNIILNNKIDGIWLDGENSLSNNLFLNNQILGNEQCGIHFGSNNKLDCIITNNTFSNNFIKNNTKGGILLCYAKENYIFENTIEGNGDFGIKILYLDGKNAICENNKIYHNNLIKNGEYGLFNKPDLKKYCNGVDSNNGILSLAKIYNQWDNGTINSKIDVNFSSSKGGNYWDDYGELYRRDFANDLLGYRGIWKWEYHMKIQLSLYFFKGFISKKINLDFLQSKASDQYPWCRKNGWNPSRPDKPSLKVNPDFLNPKKYFIKCYCNDSNEDKIIYEINIINSTNNESINGWQVLNAKPVNSSENFDCIYTFNKNGFYNICIRAYDVRDGNDNFGKGYDGKSEIAIKTVLIY